MAPFVAPSRDEPTRLGRFKISGGTNYCGVPLVHFITGSTLSQVAGVDRYTPWRVASPILVDQLAAEVVATGTATNFRIGFYRADGDWQPTGAPLADSGNLAAGSQGVKTYTPASPVYVPRGRYLSVVNADGTCDLRYVRGGESPISDSISANSLATYFSVSRTYAAFPTPGTAWTGITFGSIPPNHVVFYRYLAA